MKYLVLIILFFAACNSKQKAVEPTSAINAQVQTVQDPIVIHDTVVVHDTVMVEKKYDSLLVIIKKKNDSLFRERFRLERVKYYNRIVQRNRSQLKFLSGWINRAIQ